MSAKLPAVRLKREGLTESRAAMVIYALGIGKDLKVTAGSNATTSDANKPQGRLERSALVMDVYRVVTEFHKS